MRGRKLWSIFLAYRREPTIVIASMAVVATAVILISCQLQEASASFFDDSAAIFSSILKPSIMDGFSLYEDSIHKASIQYPLVWDRHQIFNSDYVTVVEFIIPGTLPPIKNISDIGALKKLSEEVLTNPYDKVIFRIKSLPVETIPTLKNITGDEVKTLGFRFDNFRFLSTSYDIKMGEILASKTLYLYTDNGTQKQGMQVNAVQGYKQITLEYSSIPQDFDKFLPTINKMINSFRLMS